MLNCHFDPLLPPQEIVKTPFSCHEARTTIQNILQGQDDRLLIVTGPCSLHDSVTALEYAHRLQELSHKVEDNLFLVMRAFVEKPRSRLGWKGLLSGSSSLNEGLLASRHLLEQLAPCIPLATEFLEPFSAPYLSDLISLGFIGARTSASQIHRQIASALPCPVGFKNSVEGDIAIAVHGALSARSPHAFMTINALGQAVQATSLGNPASFIVLRGSQRASNYHPEALSAALSLLQEEGLEPHLMIDCSHGNSGKDYRKQAVVFQRTLELLKEWPIRGLMLESHLRPGLELSLTDSCIGWEETEELILQAADSQKIMI